MLPLISSNLFWALFWAKICIEKSVVLKRSFPESSTVAPAKEHLLAMSFSHLSAFCVSSCGGGPLHHYYPGLLFGPEEAVARLPPSRPPRGDSRRRSRPEPGLQCAAGAAVAHPAVLLPLRCGHAARYRSAAQPLDTRTHIFTQTNDFLKFIFISVADPWHFGVDPDHRPSRCQKKTNLQKKIFLWKYFYIIFQW